MRAVFAIIAALFWLLSTSEAGAQTSEAQRAGLRYLDWPGKAKHVEAAEAGLRPAIRPAAPVAAAHPALPALRPLAPPPAAAPVFAPRSIYEAPPAPAGAAAPVMTARAAPAPVAVASAAPAENDRPRRYSLHRDYGEAADRIPLPTPLYLDALPVDLAAPPPHKPSAKQKHDARDADENPETPQDPDGGL
jgi:hypothetical protein